MASHARLTVIPVVLSTLMVSGCKEPAPPPQLPPPTVQIIELQPRDVSISTEWIGTLAGSVTASIRSQVEGTLLKQNYEEGRPVKKDAILFELDDRTYKAALADANARLAEAKANLGKTEADVARLGPLLQSRAVSQQDYDNAVQANLANKAAVAAAQATVDKAALNVSFTSIKSPVDGVAGLAKAQVGDLVTPGNMELATVATVNPIKAYFTVSEQEYLRYRQEHPEAPQGRAAGGGKTFEIILSDGTLYPHKGTFYAADVTVNPGTGSLRLCALFDNPDQLLLPGQYARVRSEMRYVKGALTVPQRAVNELQGIAQIGVVTADGKASVRRVKTGPRIGSDWLIEEGLQAGDKVIVEGFLKIRDGLPVTAVPFAGNAPTAAPKASPAAAKEAK